MKKDEKGCVEVWARTGLRWFPTICFPANYKGVQCIEYIKIMGGSRSQHCNEFYDVSSFALSEFQSSDALKWTAKQVCATNKQVEVEAEQKKAE